VIPKVVGIDRESSYTTGHMQGPPSPSPSPSKTLILAKALGGTAGTGAVGGGEVADARMVWVEGNRNPPFPHISGMI